MHRTLLLILLIACDKPSKPAPAPAPGSASAAVAPIDAATVVAVADAALADAITIDAAPIACTAQAIGQARKEAEAHVKAGRFDEAIKLLDGGTCYLEMDQPDPLKLQIAWRLSDLAFAYYKAGRFADCYGLAAGQTPPYAGNVGFFFGESDGVMKALDYNANICEQAATKDRGKFEAGSDTKCTIAKDAIEVPASALDGTDKAACLVIEPGKKDHNDMNECGDVTLVRQSKKGRISKQKLVITDGNLAEGSVCCNIEGVSFGRHGANLAILVETLGRDCNGGTASSEEQHAYELVGDKLELFHSLGAIAH